LKWGRIEGGTCRASHRSSRDLDGVLVGDLRGSVANQSLRITLREPNARDGSNQGSGGSSVEYFQTDRQKRIDDLEGLIALVDNDGASRRGPRQKIGMLDIEVAAVRQMDPVAPKRLGVLE